MSYRSRIYRTTKLKNGDRIVSSMRTSNWIIWVIIKYFFKLCFFMMFFWIIIPIKFLKESNERNREKV